MSFSKLFRKKTVQDILKQVAKNEADGHNSLGKHLKTRDLAAFGIAAIVGAGIFSTIGKASYDGGPGVIFLFLFTAIACSFAAFAYAEFASMVPVSGSAYTYSYVAFGEIIAWIIGWALIMEYAIGNITVAISWSDYFTGLLDSMGLHLPQYVQMDYLTASNGFKEATALMQGGKSYENLSDGLKSAHTAWTTSPTLGGFHFVADLPALFIIILITALVYRGMKESRNASNFMVVVKLCIILLVIAVGVFYVDTANWHPFAPNGVGGILKGVSAVFFAYIGFDAISTTAEECENPQRDLPRGMMWAIIICTVLYIIIALVLTGMVNYSELNVGDPLAFVFEKLNLKWMSGIIAVSAVIAMASVLLVFQMGQPRIWMSMSRDGLLPKRFSKVHPKFKTPSYATIVTGFVVAIPALFLNLTMVTDLCSIGTLFAFVLVCAGVLVLQNKPNIPRGKFKTPYINSKFVMPFLIIIGLVITFTYSKQSTIDFLTNEKQINAPATIVTSLNKEQTTAVVNYISKNNSNKVKPSEDLEQVLSDFQQKDDASYKTLVDSLPIDNALKYESGFSLFKHKIPMWIFLIVLFGLTIWSNRQNLSLIPLLGLIFCLYMMAELSIWNWIYFTVWLLIGLCIYFGFSRKNSKLNFTEPNSDIQN
ncbi:amino acid permease [Flavobacterium psychrophilum]|uniref:Amino acid permease n=2 Tax=Flavobacterium psychrophilum TaxID=96345 RepID=A0A7U2R9S3_FLAPS|nr:amino acid permease [Flavobacterium psychrophilum]EKT3963412.1 amino acid permease [Flavobacterium psychrophilum]EKT3965082.1 amino acid permease [Flavobacterium psychrophilum]EKT4497867.1 amino acid permease [Flavobacterium psychrophilum]EKT4500685.1 amino acid permease [Flavobacterium psychrophilum]EKT4516921.1 amino acid permease [Flavobacterium psychrophilum]